MRHSIIALIPLCLLIASAPANAVAGRRLFKFMSQKDFAPFQLMNARWDEQAGGIVVKPRNPASSSEQGATRRSRSVIEDPYPDAVVESPEVETGMPTKEIIVSWNAITPPGSHLHVYIRTRHAGVWSRRLTVAIWNRNNEPTQRTSLKRQKVAFGRFECDTMFLTMPADAFRVSAALSSSDGKTYPTLRVLTVNVLSAEPSRTHIGARKAAWGQDVPVPERSQLTIPQGNRFCSATSTAMMLDFWAQKLGRPELSVPLQTAVDGIYDRGWGGTGNWPFNTAYASEFGGLRAYITRLASLAELEMWILEGLPVIVSLDYNKLNGRDTDQRMGHLMVLRGFTPEGDPIFNDPYTKLDKGESVRKVFKRANFEQSWLTEIGSQGVVYLIYPDGWRIPKNKYHDW